MKVDLSKVKKGDRIWTIEAGWEEVIDINSCNNYPIETKNSTYAIDGKWKEDHKYPSAFLECPFGVEPIEKDTLVWFRDCENESFKVGYYSRFEEGLHYIFNNSKKSTEATGATRWKIVTTENPLL
jgi:hypothetical protein